MATVSKQRLDAELKSAMLGGDKDRATLIRGLKSAVLYEEVQLGIKDTGLSDQQVVVVLRREAKKRKESAELYVQGGNMAKANQELGELSYIESLLPAALNEADVQKAVQAAIEILQPAGLQDMGKVIAHVRQASEGAADGALVARLVKEALDSRSL